VPGKLGLGGGREAHVSHLKRPDHLNSKLGGGGRVRNQLAVEVEKPSSITGGGGVVRR